MPRYHTQQDVLDRIGEDLLVILSDRNGDQLSDFPAIDAAIFDSEAEVDCYIGNRYSLPLPGVVSDLDPSLNIVPPVLMRICCDITIFRLANEHDRCTEIMNMRYAQATGWLERLSERKVSLGITYGTLSSHGGPFIVSPDRVFRIESNGGELL